MLGVAVAWLVSMAMIVGVHCASPAAVARSSSVSYSAVALADEIIDLPGINANDVPFRHFSGYLNVDNTTGKNLFYWFVESESQPSTDPVVLWTNGGPGCSGLLGLLSENGPFRPTENGTLDLFDYRWNSIANMLFIETPTGVGYSYSETKADYTTGDDQTALDNYNLALAFFARYPHLLKNEFYIASESYGGHYMPQLALQIVKGNIAGVNQALNFKGLIVGNPYIDSFANTLYGEFPTYWGHQLTSDALWSDFQSTCIANGWEGKAEEPCNNAMQAIYDNLGDLDPYALDFPLCPGGTTFSQGERIRSHTMKHRGLSHKWGYEYEMCEMDFLSAYLQRADVMAALHASNQLSVEWASCSAITYYSMADIDRYTEPEYLELLSLMPDIKLTILSGDDDSVCATQGTQHILASLGLDIIRPWTPWYMEGQVGGYAVWYEGISFFTVHTAGHMIPQTQPARSFFMFQHYLAGTLPGYNETSTFKSSTMAATAAAAGASHAKHVPRRHHAAKHAHVNAEVALGGAHVADATVSVAASSSSSSSPSVARVHAWSPSRLHTGAVTELPYAVPRASPAERHASYRRIRQGRRRVAALRTAAAALEASSSSTKHSARSKRSSKVLQPSA